MEKHRSNMIRFILVLIITGYWLQVAAQTKDLDYFIGQTIANSPLLKDYDGQLSSLEIDRQLFQAGLKPQVNGVSNNFLAPVVAGWGYDKAITNGQQLSALVAASKTMLSKKSIASQLETISLQGQTVSNSKILTAEEIKKTVTEQYVTVYGEQLQLDFYDRINSMLLKEDSVLKKLTQDNVYKQSDYLAFVVTRQQQLLISSQLLTQYKYDHTVLNYLAGIVDTTVVRLNDPALGIYALNDSLVSIFFKQYELDSLSLSNERALIDRDYRPKISLFADAGYYSSFAYKAYKNFGTSFGINLSIPIYDGKQRKMKYSKLDIREQNRLVQKDFFARQRRQQLLQLVQQLASTDQQIEQIEKQIRYTETLVTINEKLLATGDIRLTDFIMSLSNYINARYLVTQNKISRLHIINQLRYWSK